MIREALIATALIVVAGTPAPAAPVARGPLDLAALRASVGLSGPQISPDGRSIALVVRRPDYEHDRFANELVLVDVATRAQTVLTRDHPAVANVRWSPAGDRLAFVALETVAPPAKEKPKPQLFVLRMGGGEARMVTHAPGGVGAFAWRPDGRAFAYASEEIAPNRARIERHEDAFEVTDAAWVETAAPLPSHLFTIAADGGRATALTAGDETVVGGIAYAGLGTIVFGRAAHAGNHYRRTSLATIDVASRRERALLALQHTSNPVVAPDGSHVAFRMEDPRAASQTDIGLATIAGGGLRVLSRALDRNVAFIAFAADGRSVYTGANDATRDNLYRIDLAGAVRRLALGDANLSGAATVSRDGTLAFVASGPTRPPELYVLRRGAPAVALTRFNARIAAHLITPTRTIVWRSRDGFTLDGALTEPVGLRAGRRYPLVLVIHGGPTATSTTSYGSLAQLMAARGWFVFQPNYRGSDNLGAAFAQATVPHITSAPSADVEDGLAAVLAHEPIDRTRIGVSGWSEGGLMTSWLITHDRRWRAAMSGAAVNDWVQYADLTDSKDFTPSFIGPSPWTSDAMMRLYEAESPLSYAANVTTPTLIMTDGGDQRVPEPLDYEFYHAIRATGTPVELVVFPRDGHFPTDPVGIDDVSRRWVDWFVTHF